MVLGYFKLSTDINHCKGIQEKSAVKGWFSMYCCSARGFEPPPPTLHDGELRCSQ